MILKHSIIRKSFKNQFNLLSQNRRQLTE